MDGYQFIAALCGSLAWPIAAVLLGLTLRGSVVDLIARVKSFKGFGAELTVAERSAIVVEELPDAVESSEATALAETDGEQIGEPAAEPKRLDSENITVPSPDNPSPVQQSAQDGVRNIGLKQIAISASKSDADDSADLAGTMIQAAWAKLATNVQSLRRQSIGNRSIGATVQDSSRKLFRAGLIPESLADAISALGRIRNEVVHGRTRVSTVDALSYQAAVASVLSALLSSVAQNSGTLEIASAIRGQGDMATMQYAELVDRLRHDLRIPDGDGSEARRS